MTEGPVRVLFVLGHGRSGSTLLGNILGEAEGVLHAGEVRFLWSWGILRGRRCGCGEPVVSCPFWSPVVEEALAGGGPSPERINGQLRESTRLRALPRLLGGQAGPPPDIQAVLGRLYRAAARRGGARVVVDSSKMPAYAALVSRVPGVEASFLHLVRDPRAAAYSWLRPKDREGGTADPMPRYPAWRSARAWVVANVAASRVARSGLGPWRRIRYEDFASSPADAVEDILRFVGESSGVPFTDDRTVNVGVQHTVSGNPLRFQRGAVEVRVDERWETGLGSLDRLVVTGITLPLLHRYGYPLRSGGGGRPAVPAPER
jgi:hypothetical protein